jgi:NAD(P)-dependent dehydrogenase (short-subunit alcohol dehydrogenase family)
MTADTLHGHIALVTGGSRGIGAAIVRSLAEAGNIVALNFRERATEANTLVNPLARWADMPLQSPRMSRKPTRPLSAYPARPEVIGAGHDVFDPERT